MRLPLKRFRKEERSDELLVWIKQLYDKEFKEILRIWEQVPADTWIMYSLMKLVGLREQEALRLAYNEFRKIWEARYAKRAEETTERLPH